MLYDILFIILYLIGSIEACLSLFIFMSYIDKNNPVIKIGTGFILIFLSSWLGVIVLIGCMIMVLINNFLDKLSGIRNPFYKKKENNS